EHFEILVTSQSYNITLDVGDNLVAIGDAKKIEQVIYNLISNAVNYTGEDKKVVVKLFTSAQKKIRFEVIDTGKGIPKKDIDQIWDRYYRSNKLHKRETSGSGLGLSIVKGILTAHDAEYGVKSELEKGSDFYFIINKSSK
ncbi:MAG: ATP-binding protein, partial [Clostridia bacterium]